MTLTFIFDALSTDAHRLALRDHDGRPGGLFDLDATPHLAATDGAHSRRGVAWRLLSALFSPLRSRRRRLPPQDEHLRRDIGLSERELPREYWEYWWHHR